MTADHLIVALGDRRYRVERPGFPVVGFHAQGRGRSGRRGFPTGFPVVG